MYTEFSKKQKWTTDTIENLFKQIKTMSNDDKCIFVTDTAKDLIESGDEKKLRAAEALLLGTIKNYFNVSDSSYKASIYYTLAYLYETTENYTESCIYYEKFALNNTLYEGAHAILLRNLLLRDNFSYSNELEKELQRSYYDYDLGLRNDRIYQDIAEYLVFVNENKQEKAEAKKQDLKALVKYGQFPFLDIVIRKDEHLNALDVPKKVIDFVNSL